LYRVGLRTILRLFLLCIVWLRLSTIMIKRKWWWWWWWWWWYLLHCQPTPSHQCSTEFLSLVACVKYIAIPSIQGQGQGPPSRPRPRPRPRIWIARPRTRTRTNITATAYIILYYILYIKKIKKICSLSICTTHSRFWLISNCC